MNINLTTYCNLNCPYCYAVDLWKSAGDKQDDREISIKNLRIVIDLMKRSGLSEFRMFGGEPTLHSRFEEVYDLVSRNGFGVSIFSNGIIAKERVEFLSRKKNLNGLAISVLEPAFYSPKQSRMLKFTLSRLNRFINLGFVVYQPDFDAYFIVDLIKKYNLRRLMKWSISTPCFKHKNVFVKLKDHKKVAAGLVEHSRIFKRHHIIWTPDTIFMSCLFTKGQSDELLRNVGFRPLDLCTPALEVAPNLTVYRCYGAAALTNPALKITDFRDAAEAHSYFVRKEMHFKKVGVFKECFNCDLKGRTCNGGCVVHILKSLPKQDWGYIY